LQDRLFGNQRNNVFIFLFSRQDLSFKVCSISSLRGLGSFLLIEMLRHRENFSYLGKCLLVVRHCFKLMSLRVAILYCIIEVSVQQASEFLVHKRIRGFVSLFGLLQFLDPLRRAVENRLGVADPEVSAMGGRLQSGLDRLSFAF